MIQRNDSPTTRAGHRLQLGFAAIWEPPLEATWSYIPWHLRNALRERGPVHDVGLELFGARQAALKALHVRHFRGTQRSSYRYSPMLAAMAGRTFRRGAVRAGCDAVLQIQDCGVIEDLPYFVYHDAGLDALEPYRDPTTGGYPYLARLTRSTVDRLRERQRAIYSRAAGVFAMSEWFARSLVADTGLPRDRVHVVHPGANAFDGTEPLEPRTADDGPRRRLLFVGKHFFPKGGDLVLAALDHIRRHHDPEVTLTVVGPVSWAIGDVPDGVTFLGRQPVSAISALYASHDLFVMPSRIEPFGIVFVEALAHGLPCIGRDAFEMPAIIRPGENGGLVDSDDVDALAALVVKCLADDALYARCERERASVVEHYSWARAAGQIHDVICSTMQLDR